MFSDLLDLSALTNTSGEVTFGFDNYALQIQDLDPDVFKGQTFTVNLGSAHGNKLCVSHYWSIM